MGSISSSGFWEKRIGMKTHIQLPNDIRHTHAIVCGSPTRAEYFASKLESSQPLAKNREYHSYLGRYRGKDVVIVSHGVGSAGAAICFQELIDAGAKKIIRIGTVGSFVQGMPIGGIIVPTAAIRKDGVSGLMIPLEYPAISDLKMTSALIKQLESSGNQYSSGVVLTSDLFYPGKLDPQFQFFSDAGAVGVEMECSALFIISQLRGVRSASLLVSDGNPLDDSTDNYDPSPERLKASLDSCFEAALEVLIES